nr:hypothetical protein BCU07_11075 [Vibrio sp. 10N.261.54.E10]
MGLIGIILFLNQTRHTNSLCERIIFCLKIAMLCWQILQFERIIFIVNFFPTPPTDNLYKFCAIFGAWLVAGVIALFMLLGYVMYDAEKQLIAQTHHIRTTGNYQRVLDRLESIEQGNLGENIIEWTLISDGSEQEVQGLLQIKSNHEKAIKEYEEAIRTDYRNAFDIAEATGVMWVILILITIAVFFFYFGFKYWYVKVQKVSDELMLTDLKIKRLTLIQLEQELRRTRKYKFSNRTK